MDKTAKIIEEVMVRTCIDKIDRSIIKEIVQDELIKYHNEVFTYGHSIGYDDGYALGYSEGHSEVITLIKMGRT